MTFRKYATSAPPARALDRGGSRAWTRWLVLVSVVALPISLGTLAWGCSGRRTVTVFPGMTLSEVEAVSEGFEAELTHDNAELGYPNLPSPTTYREYAEVVLKRGEEEVLRLTNVNMALLVLRDEIVEVYMLPQQSDWLPLTAYLRQAGELADSLKRKGWKEDWSARLAPSFLQPRNEDEDPVRRTVAQLRKEGGLVQVGVDHSPRNGAGINILFERLRTQPQWTESPD